MAFSDFIGPFIIALIMHALLFSSGSMNHKAKIVLEKGASSVTLNIVPSIASKELQTIPDVDMPDFPQRNTQNKKEETVHPLTKPPLPSSVKKIPASNCSARANTAVPEIDATPRHEEGALLEENIAQHDKQDTERVEQARQIVETVEDVTGKSMAADAGDTLNNRDNDGDVPERGERVPASAVGLSKPAYPRGSRIHGEEGTVVLSVEVLADGRPGKIDIVSSSGYRRLDRAALKAIGRARFIPARIDGRAVDSTQRIAFRFDLYD